MLRWQPFGNRKLGGHIRCETAGGRFVKFWPQTAAALALVKGALRERPASRPAAEPGKAWGMSEREKEPFSLGRGRVIRSSALAVLVDLEKYKPAAMKDGRWIPKSQIHDDSEVYRGETGETGEVVVTAWWAEMQAWIVGDDARRDPPPRESRR